MHFRAKGRAAQAKAVGALLVVQLGQRVCGYGFAHDHAGLAAPLFEQGVGQRASPRFFTQGGGGDKQRVVTHRHVQGHKSLGREYPHCGPQAC